jgi:hypothetical protein
MEKGRLPAAKIPRGRRLLSAAAMKARNPFFMRSPDFAIGSRARCSSNLSLTMLM